MSDRPPLLRTNSMGPLRLSGPPAPANHTLAPLPSGFQTPVAQGSAVGRTAAAGDAAADQDRAISTHAETCGAVFRAAPARSRGALVWLEFLGALTAVTKGGHRVFSNAELLFLEAVTLNGTTNMTGQTQMGRKGPLLRPARSIATEPPSFELFRAIVAEYAACRRQQLIDTAMVRARMQGTRYDPNTAARTLETDAGLSGLTKLSTRLSRPDFITKMRKRAPGRMAAVDKCLSAPEGTVRLSTAVDSAEAQQQLSTLVLFAAAQIAESQDPQAALSNEIGAPLDAAVALGREFGAARSPELIRALLDDLRALALPGCQIDPDAFRAALHEIEPELKATAAACRKKAKELSGPRRRAAGQKQWPVAAAHDLLINTQQLNADLCDEILLLLREFVNLHAEPPAAPGAAQGAPSHPKTKKQRKKPHPTTKAAPTPTSNARARPKTAQPTLEQLEAQRQEQEILRAAEQTSLLARLVEQRKHREAREARNAEAAIRQAQAERDVAASNAAARAEKAAAKAAQQAVEAVRAAATEAPHERTDVEWVDALLTQEVTLDAVPPDCAARVRRGMLTEILSSDAPDWFETHGVVPENLPDIVGVAMSPTLAADLTRLEDRRGRTARTQALRVWARQDGMGLSRTVRYNGGAVVYGKDGADYRVFWSLEREDAPSTMIGILAAEHGMQEQLRQLARYER